MLAREAVAKSDTQRLVGVLPSGRHWTTIVVLMNDVVERDVLGAATFLARRDAARVVLFDLQASAGWTSPFPPGESVRPFLLDEPGVRRVGRDDVADAVRDLGTAGITASAYLSTTRQGADLAQLVRTERVDLVIAPVPLDGALGRNIHGARYHGAHVLECSRGEEPKLHVPSTGGEPEQGSERIQIRFLIGLLLTFLAAGLRNRSRS
jgi:hypothetical protein